MKVTPGQSGEYLEVEKAWKKLHQKAVNEGVISSWQLYRKLHTGSNDPYDYITLQWYDNYEATLASRDIISQEVYHNVVAVDNPQPIKYLVIMRNHIPPERSTDYFKMEREIFKPYQEEMIRRGALAQWGIWTAWPYKEGQADVVIAEGFKDANQLSNPGVDSDDVLATVHPELIWDDLVKEIMKNRKQISVEVWELVDFVVAEQ